MRHHCGTVLWHGSFGRYSPFLLAQHKYAGGHGGFIELLEVLDPPEGVRPVVIHQYLVVIHKDLPASGSSSFTEWATVADAEAAWSAYWQFADNCRKIFSRCKGFLRWVDCLSDSPWFLS